MTRRRPYPDKTNTLLLLFAHDQAIRPLKATYENSSGSNRRRHTRDVRARDSTHRGGAQKNRYKTKR